MGAVEAALQPEQLHIALAAAAAAQQDWDRITGGYANKAVPDTASSQSGGTSVPLSQASLATAAASAPASAGNQAVAAAVPSDTTAACAAAPAEASPSADVANCTELTADMGSDADAQSGALLGAHQTTAAAIATAMGRAPDSPTQAAPPVAAAAASGTGQSLSTPFSDAVKVDRADADASIIAAAPCPFSASGPEDLCLAQNADQQLTDLPDSGHVSPAAVDEQIGIEAVAEQEAEEAAERERSKPAALEAVEEGLGHQEEDSWSIAATTTGVALHLYSADYQAAPSVTLEITDLAAGYQHQAHASLADRFPHQSAAAAGAQTAEGASRAGPPRTTSGGSITWSRLTVRLHDGLQEAALSASFAAAAAMQATTSPRKAAKVAAADVMDRSASGRVGRAALQQRQSSDSLSRLEHAGSGAHNFRSGSAQSMQRNDSGFGLASIMHGSSSTLLDDFSSTSSGGALGFGHGLGRSSSLRHRRRGMGSGHDLGRPFDAHHGSFGIGGLGGTGEFRSMLCPIPFELTVSAVGSVLAGCSVVDGNRTCDDVCYKSKLVVTPYEFDPNFILNTAGVGDAGGPGSGVLGSHGSGLLHAQSSTIMLPTGRDGSDGEEDMFDAEEDAMSFFSAQSHLASSGASGPLPRFSDLPASAQTSTLDLLLITSRHAPNQPTASQTRRSSTGGAHRGQSLEGGRPMAAVTFDSTVQPTMRMRLQHTAVSCADLLVRLYTEGWSVTAACLQQYAAAAAPPGSQGSDAGSEDSGAGGHQAPRDAAGPTHTIDCTSWLIEVVATGGTGSSLTLPELKRAFSA